MAPSTDSISGVGPNGVGKALHLPPRGWADDRMGHSMFTCHAHPVAASLSTMRSNLGIYILAYTKPARANATGRFRNPPQRS